MSESVKSIHDLASFAKSPGPHPGLRFSAMASGLVGSEILRIAGEIRGLQAEGVPVCDLTVGDFSPKQFPIPTRLRDAIQAALDRGETNYPPTNGLPQLREAVRALYADELGLAYPLESVLIASGSRPVIYSAYRALCDAGDRVIYPVPSWNNNHYSHLAGAAGVPLACRAEDRFMPTGDTLRPLLPGARLVCLNSPLNPTGTMIARDQLFAICEAVLAENEARGRRGDRPLYLLYDQVYRTLTFGDAVHVTPPELIPAMASCTVLVDGISKAFAATGVRVGWGVGPVDVIGRMAAILGHAGAWAPRAEQAAVTELLGDSRARADHRATFVKQLKLRLDRLHAGFQRLKAEGLPVDSIPPMGAIYLTARVHPFGRLTGAGHSLASNDDVRRFLLEAAGIGVVPFQAFGRPEDDGWFRLSVGAVSLTDIDTALPRLAAGLRALR
jgi:aspartate aminotransferase